MGRSHPDPKKPPFRLDIDGREFHAYDDDGQPICGAKTRSGGICHAYPIAGTKRCRLHNGNAKRGPEHPSFKHGNRANRNYNLPSLSVLTRRFLSDPDYLSLTKEIALCRALLEQTIHRLEQTDAGVSVKMAREGYKRIQDALVNANPERAAAELQQGVATLGQALNDLNAEQELREDIRRTLFTLNNLVRQDNIRKKMEGEFIPLPVLALLLDTLRQGVLELGLDDAQSRKFQALIFDILQQQPLMITGQAENVDAPDSA